MLYVYTLMAITVIIIIQLYTRRRNGILLEDYHVGSTYTRVYSTESIIISVHKLPCPPKHSVCVCPAFADCN